MERRCVVLIPLIGSLAAMYVTLPAPARDLDGRYANSPLKPWFDQLKSGKGLCCSLRLCCRRSRLGVKGRPLSSACAEKPRLD